MAYRKRYGKRTYAAKKDKTALSKKEATAVKHMINAAAPKSRLHNGPAPGPPFSGLVPNTPTAIVAFSNINAGQAEYQRRGDEIWIDKIHFKAYLLAGSTADAVRFTFLRQAGSSFPVPTVINVGAVWQNNTPGAGGVISHFQDDQPCQILYDRVFTIGTAAGMQESRCVNIVLDYSKRPLKMVFWDGTPLGGATNCVMGDIELVVTSAQGTCNMTYVYDTTFHEK